MSGSAARFLFKHQVLGKHMAKYFYDEQIGYNLHGTQTG